MSETDRPRREVKGENSGHNSVGDALREQGDLAGALEAYRAGLAAAKQLEARNPLSPKALARWLPATPASAMYSAIRAI